jgi:hypothetical protein
MLAIPVTRRAPDGHWDRCRELSRLLSRTVAAGQGQMLVERVQSLAPAGEVPPGQALRIHVVAVPDDLDATADHIKAERKLAHALAQRLSALDEPGVDATIRGLA